MNDRPEPQLNRWLELTVPPEDLAEVSGWLQELCDYRSGRLPPGSVTQRRVTAKLAAYARLAREGARQVAARNAAARGAACAAPTPPVVVPAQTPASSEAEEITTADAAALTGKSRERMRQLVAGGQVRGRRTAHRAWLLSRADVIATLEGSTDGARSGTGPHAA